jgi:RNA polymerase sigma factor (TIGR02999 family)
VAPLAVPFLMTKRAVSPENEPSPPGAGSTEASASLRDGDSAGAPVSLNSLFPIVYDELRRLARRQLKRESSDNTLTTTALVHEAYLRLADHTRVSWQGRAHFLGVAAIAMRRILVDQARRHGARKRGSGLKLVTFDEMEIAAEDQAELLMAVDEALTRLGELDPRQARVVECRFFGGMTEEETAEALGVGLRTVKRDWAKAKSWLYQAIYPETLD